MSSYHFTSVTTDRLMRGDSGEWQLNYPNNAWMCLRRDVFDRLYPYKVRHGIPIWEGLLEAMIPDKEVVEK